jgi:hypothetical protein
MRHVPRQAIRMELSYRRAIASLVRVLATWQRLRLVLSHDSSGAVRIVVAVSLFSDLNYTHYGSC